jgi:tetratricopeptide (TPR) repeat protein
MRLRPLQPLRREQAAVKAGDKSGEGMAYDNISVVLYSLSRYDEALEYHKKTLEIWQQDW